MPEQRVYSENATYQGFEVLKHNRAKRYRQRCFLVEGVRNINQAIAQGWTLRSLLYPGETALSGWAQELLETVDTDMNYRLRPALMAALSGKEQPSELLAVVEMRQEDPALLRLSANPLLMLFDRPSNHGNLGTIIRSADALGADALLLTGHGVDPYDVDVITASMGSFFRLPVMRVPHHGALTGWLQSLRRGFAGFVVLGTTAHQACSLYEQDLRGPLLWIIGNETDGLSRALGALCDKLVTIPMASGTQATSLNVGCAASILLSETARQRL